MDLLTTAFSKMGIMGKKHKKEKAAAPVLTPAERVIIPRENEGI